MRFLARFKRRTPVRVDLEPAQVTAVLFLLRFGRSTDESVLHEMEASHNLDRARYEVALSELATKGVVGIAYDGEAGLDWVWLTPLGKRLKGKLKPGLRVGLAVYV
ncbi:MAG: hypothetical protein ACKVVT_18475 [Dehalococcoidia bacterium]